MPVGGLTLAGDTDSFLERSATNQWGMMICVYFVSYAPALLMLRIPAYEHQNAKLLFFLVLVVQLSDFCNMCSRPSTILRTDALFPLCWFADTPVVVIPVPGCPKEDTR